MSRPTPAPVLHLSDPNYTLDLSGARATMGGHLVVHVERADHVQRVHIGPDGILGETTTDPGRCGCRVPSGA